MAPITINGFYHESLSHIPHPEDPDFDTDYILVECQHHLGPADLIALEAAGAKILTRQGNDNTYLCRHTDPVRDGGLRIVEALPFVKTARVYHESLVVSPDVSEALVSGDGRQDHALEDVELEIHLHSCERTGLDIFQAIRDNIDPEVKMVTLGDTFVRVNTRPVEKNIRAMAAIDDVCLIRLPPVLTCATWIATKAMTWPLGEAWKKDDGSEESFRGLGEVIGVIDTGFADGSLTGHSAFQNRVIKVDWADPSLQDPTKPASLPADTFGHGTAVAACALGSSGQTFVPNAVISPPQERCRAIVGPAPEARLYAVRVSNTEDKMIINRDTVFKMEYEQPKKVPRIWNMSICDGYTDKLDPKISGYGQDASQTDVAANLDLEQVIVQSAGNEGLTWPRSPAGKRVFRQITNMASAKNVITVGATANNRWQSLVDKKFSTLSDPSKTTRVKAGLDSAFVDGWGEANLDIDPATGQKLTWDQVAINYGCITKLASESSKGPTQEGRIKPDLVCPGYGMLTARSPVEKKAEKFNACPFPEYKFASGTSFAAPMVAGLVAALRQALREEREFSDPKATTIKAILINAAKDLGGSDYPKEHTNFDWQYPELIRKPSWFTSEMPPAPNAAQGFGLPDLDRSLMHLTHMGNYQELVISNNTPGLKLTEAIELPDMSQEDPEARDDQMLRITLVWSDPPGVLMINKLKLGVMYTDKNGTAVPKDPDPVHAMWWERIDQDPPTPEQYPNVQRITLNRPYDFTEHKFTVEVPPGTTILPFNHNGQDVRTDQPVSVVWALYPQGT